MGRDLDESFIWWDKINVYRFLEGYLIPMQILDMAGAVVEQLRRLLSRSEAFTAKEKKNCSEAMVPGREEKINV
jgi:hypothetical protein